VGVHGRRRESAPVCIKAWPGRFDYPGWRAVPAA